MAWYSSVSVRIILLGLLASSLTVIAAEATLVVEPVDALPLHALHVSLTPDSLDALITNTQLGAVTFGGNLTIDKPQGVERVTVTLAADTNQGWPVVISPQSIAFINPGTERFSVTVIVPPDTPTSVATVTVRAQANSPIWTETQTTEARVNVMQFYEFEIWIDGSVGEGVAGESISGEFVIFNNGTGEDTFLITLEDVPESITIPSKMEMDIQFTFGIDDDYDVPFAGEMFSLVFKVRSTGANEPDTQREYNVPYYIFFEGLKGKLVNNWPTFVGYGVVIVLASFISFIVFKKVRRSRRGLPEPKGTIE